MARNDDTQRGAHTSHSRTAGERDRKRDRVIETVKDRPYATAALATVAAGAAAFFLTRSKSDKPLMNWGQDSHGDQTKGAGAFKGQASTTRERKFDTTSTASDTGSTSPSAAQAAGLKSTGTSAGAAHSDSKNTGGAGKTTGNAKAGDTGLDTTAKDQTKTGSVAYGA